MTPKLKKIIILVLIIVLMFVIYTLTNKQDTQIDPLLVNDVSSNQTALLGVQISQALLRIEQITLDKSIFQDKIYITLQDRSTTILDEPRGRTNPFAPIGNVSSSSNVIEESPAVTSTTSTEGVTPNIN
jgi:hypothetical protein